MVKLQVLMENTTRDPELEKEHGLSLYIETEKHKILFDAGQSGKFADNAEKMGVDLKAVDKAILSHGHYDHGGGFNRFFEINDTARLYLSRFAMLPTFHGQERYIGLPLQLMQNTRLVHLSDYAKIGDSLYLYSCNRMGPMFTDPSTGLNILQNGRLQPDTFMHEHYLLIKDGDRKILISGCSHKGILNIVKWFEPDILVGGFHFMDIDPDSPKGRKRLENAARKLSKYPTQYYTGHCTGKKQFEAMKEILGDQLHAISTGDTFYL